MATVQEIAEIALNWSIIIRAIPGYEDLEFAPKGDPDSIATLLANWTQAPAGYDVPTEAQLLTALAVVEAQIVATDATEAVQIGAETQAAAIPGFAHWTEQEGLDWIDENIGNGAIAAVTNLAEAKALMIKQAIAFRALWRVSKAFLNHTWPNLEGSE
jgi:hypothetical protein